ncbi:unnamed protein product [Symbiodinium microadriaticum]|nr:unnamed protein product [Symbiodinium microadriaticum]
MANYSESKSVLQSRLTAVGFAESDVTAILGEVGNLRRLAFISSFTPGQADEAPLMQVLSEFLKRDPSISDKANWRAVFNEAYAVVTAEMKQRIEKVDAEPSVRPLSQPERAERYERQEDELRGEKKKDIKFTVEEASGKLRVEHKSPDLIADTSSEIMVQQALTRRALAMDQANLIDFVVMDQWTQRLMKARLQAPAESFAKPTWKQLEAADRQLFTELREKTFSCPSGTQGCEVPRGRSVYRFGSFPTAGFKFSSFNIFEDVQTDRHKDHWNANLANLAIPLTPFKEGSIFVEHQGGLDLSAVNGEPGTRLRVALGVGDSSCRRVLCSLKAGYASALAADALYTPTFCDRFAGLMQLAVGNAGLLLQEVRPLQCSSHAAMAAAGKQPRLSKFRPQIEEFKCQATVRSFPWPLPLDSKGNLKSPIGPVPAGSRLLRVMCDWGVVGAKKTESLNQTPTAVTFGIYRSESEFVAQALHLEHPFDLCVAVPDFMLRALAFNLKEGPVGVMKHRIALLQKWSAWKRDLADDEKRLHASMEPGVAAVMRGKHILLLERIAASFGWPDTEVFKCLKNGFPLVGESQPSGIFDVDRKPASLTREELLQHSKFLRPALWAKVSSSPLDETARCIWETTQQELIEKEWLTGPFSWEQLQARYPGGWLPVRRFGLVQKDKTRSIDDLAENSVNQAYAVSDRISLRALDELVWMAIAIFKVLC